MYGERAGVREALLGCTGFHSMAIIKKITKKILFIIWKSKMRPTVRCTILLKPLPPFTHSRCLPRLPPSVRQSRLHSNFEINGGVWHRAVHIQRWTTNCRCVHHTSQCRVRCVIGFICKPMLHTINYVKSAHRKKK